MGSKNASSVLRSPLGSFGLHSIPFLVGGNGGLGGFKKLLGSSENFAKIYSTGQKLKIVATQTPVQTQTFLILLAPFKHREECFPRN